MQAFNENAKEVLTRLGTDAVAGLTDAQVEENRAKYGENQLTRQKQKSFWQRFWEAAREPMTIILIVAWLITIAVNIVELVTGGEPEFIEAVGIMLAILLCILITVVMEGKSQKAFDALNKIRDDIQVKVTRNGKLELLSQSQIVVGDLIHLETGDKIPVDARLLSSIDLSVEESALTGESVSVDKDASAVLGEDVPLAERINMLYAGCFVAAGRCDAVVTAVGDATEFGKIAGELGSAQKTSTPLQEKLAKLGKTITLIGSLLAAAIFVIQLVRLIAQGAVSLDSVQEIFISSIVLIVAAVPEGLPTIVAVSLSLNVIKMAKQQALVKKLVACETVGSINIICSDKTGTLTENKMTAVEFWADGVLQKPEELCYEPLIENVCINSSANVEYNLDQPQFIGSSTECALLVGYDKARKEQGGLSYQERRERATVEKVIPFSSEEKSMSTILKDGEGFLAYTKGSPEKVLSLCSHIALEGKILPLDDAMRKSVEEKVEGFQRQAMRLLAFAHKNLETWQEDTKLEGMVYDGFAAITDPLRNDVKAAVDTCRAAGIDLKMLTGDNVVTARAIAKELDMLDDNCLVLEARDVEQMDDQELLEKVEKIRVIARSTPGTKLRVVRALKSLGNVVAVTGDGINDAPAIKNADVGIAMGVTGTEVSKEASDVVLLDDSFSTIVRAVHWGRGIYENFQRFIQFQLTVNVSSVAVVLASILLGFAAPFTALQLLWINVIMDGPPALTLGLEPLRNGLMERRPTPRDASIVTGAMLGRILCNGLFMVALFLWQLLGNVLGGTPEQQPTILFTIFVLFQLMNAFNCRELGHESIFANFGGNRIMLLTFLGTLILQVIITQFGGEAFNTVPLDLAMWGKMLAYALAIPLVSEIYRLLARLVEHARGRALKNEQ